MAGTLDISPTC